MAVSQVEALLRIVETAGIQLDLLEDAAKRPEVDRAGLSEAGLELLLQSIASNARDAAESESDPGLQDRLRAFADRVARWKSGAVQVSRHLLELATDWTCKQCGSDVPRGARISGVRAAMVQVEIVCRACGAATKLNPKGKKAFERWFGPLVKPEWNPKLHGFEWDGR